MRKETGFSIFLLLILTINALAANSQSVTAFDSAGNNNINVTPNAAVNPPTVLWDQIYTDNISTIPHLGSNLNCMIQTNDGGYAMAGITSANRATNFIWFVKTDSLGNEQWVKYFGFNSAGSSADAFSVIQTADSGYALAGYRSGYPDGGGVWLVKTDSSGNQQWNKTYGSNGGPNLTVFTVVQTIDNGYALAGFQNQNVNELNHTLLIRTDSLGNMQWNKTYRELNGATSMIKTSDGGYALVGNATSLSKTGYAGFGLLKTDSSGNVQWNQTFGSANLKPIDFAFSSGFPQNGAPISVVQTSDGAFAVSGTIGTSNGNRFGLLRTDMRGNLLWNQTYGELNDNDIAASLIQDRDGGYALAGSKYNGSKSYFDFWLIKTDSLGTTEWNQTFERAGSLQYAALVQTLIQTSDLGYAVLGNVATDLSWLIKTSSPTPKTFTITVTQGVNGVISPDSSTVTYGSNQTFTITPNAGYHISNVVVDSVSQGPISSYIFTNVSTSHTITATYAQTVVALTVNTGTNGQSNIASGNVAWGSIENFVFTPNTNYHVTDVIVNGTIDQGAVATLNLNITGPTTVAVSFAQTSWTITVTQGVHGTISPSTTVYSQGSSQNEVVTPDSGYYIASVTVDGNAVAVTAPSGQTVSFNNMQAAHTITASFAQVTWTITVTQNAHGTISPATASYAQGSSQNENITPDNGYFIASITADGNTVAVTSQSGQNVGFNNIQAAHSITATFAQVTWTITVNQSIHGAISPSTASYTQGASQSEVVTPDSGYYIESITVDGNPVTVTTPSGQTVSFTNIQVSHAIMATFALTPTPTPSPPPTPTPPDTSTPIPTPNPTTSPLPTFAPVFTSTPTPAVTSKPTLSPTNLPTQTLSPTQSATTDPTANPTDTSSLPQGAIYGIIAVIAVVVIFSTVLILGFLKKRKDKKR